ncbi:MAG: 50S ribosomal protein L21 [Helicobacter sp.]|nr:50S ribosomal protein L21 [Helicobacter sp.]
MYAVFKNGSRQYRVKEGDIILLDKMSKEPKSEVCFDEVLFIQSDDGSKVGTPFIPGAKIQAQVINEGRGKKVIIFKKRRRKDSKLKRGFRRDFTRVVVQKISF